MSIAALKLTMWSAHPCCSECELCSSISMTILHSINVVLHNFRLIRVISRKTALPSRKIAAPKPKSYLSATLHWFRLKYGPSYWGVNNRKLIISTIVSQSSLCVESLTHCCGRWRDARHDNAIIDRIWHIDGQVLLGTNVAHWFRTGIAQIGARTSAID